MAPYSTPVWTEGSARARAEQQKPEVGSFRWGSRTFYTESGKKPSQELVDLDVNTLTPQVPSRPVSSLSSFVSLLKCHLILWASYPEDSGEKSTLPHTLFSLPFFSPQQFSALICYIFICTCRVCLLSPEHVALGAGTLTLRWQAGIVQLSWQLSSRWADTNHAAQQARITWSVHAQSRDQCMSSQVISAL